ncbi:MAG: hypothetical protein WC107_03875 [Patescibacteria group bacterium]
MSGEFETVDPRNPREIFHSLFDTYSNFLLSLEHEQYGGIVQAGGIESYSRLGEERVEKAKKFQDHIKYVMGIVRLSGADIARLKELEGEPSEYQFTEEEVQFALKTEAKVKIAFEMMKGREDEYTEEFLKS